MKIPNWFYNIAFGIGINFDFEDGTMLAPTVYGVTGMKPMEEQAYDL